MITAENLSRDPGVRHLFFTRQGGVSGGIYESLNCGPGSSDAREHVLDNRARAMAAMMQMSKIDISAIKAAAKGE